MEYSKIYEKIKFLECSEEGIWWEWGIVLKFGRYLLAYIFCVSIFCLTVYKYFLDRLFFWIIFYQDWKDFLVWVYLFQKEGLS